MIQDESRVFCYVTPPRCDLFLVISIEPSFQPSLCSINSNWIVRMVFTPDIYKSGKLFGKCLG